MSKSISIVGALVFSSLWASHYVQAEESQAFVARNQKAHTNFKQDEEIMAEDIREPEENEQASPENTKIDNIDHT